MANGRKRGDPNLAEDLRKLDESIGANKLAPDRGPDEQAYSRSLKIRNRIREYLMQNDGTTWRNLRELHARAANFANCSEVTAARWVFQYTRVGAPCEIIDAVEYIMLQLRGNGGEEPHGEVRA